MASAIPKLLSRSQSTKFIAGFHRSQVLGPTIPFLLHPSRLADNQSQCPETRNLNPNSGAQESNRLDPSKFSMIYPSFRFEFPLNIKSSTGIFRSEAAEDIEMDDSKTVRADSVKKKRKKKMNKHKYKKLRKRLRGKT